jgi:N-acetylglucosamine kinase-like BadF-type ATPase
MILIADSGSTKTDWRLINNDGEAMSFETIGFNPYIVDSDIVLNGLLNSDLAAIKKSVKQVYFYGAGCSSEAKCKVVANPLTTFFSNAKISVEHDMLAAARATCGNEKGMIAILGTGSNSCLFDGNIIAENVTALGYILGDYGSGVDIGKALVKALMGKELPSEIESKFSEDYNLTTVDILDAVYKQAFPNRFLAGFSLFMFKNLDNPIILKMVESRFEIFFEKNICKYSNYENNTLHLVGSIAFIYQDVVKKIAEMYNVKIGKIIKQPIEELVKFHI